MVFSFRHLSYLTFIIFLKCIDKLLEKVVVCKLTYLASQHNLILDYQFESKTNFHTLYVISIFVHDVHNS